MILVKYIKTMLFLLLTAVLLVPVLPAQANDYTIVIDNNGVTKNQESIFHCDNADSNDKLSHDIAVSNKANKAYIVRLKSIEVLENSILLDKMSFSFEGVSGGNNINFTKDDFNTIGQPELYVAAQNYDGSFALKTNIGNLTNEYQGTSVAIRYTFEITQLYGGEATGGDATGDDAPNTADNFTLITVLWPVFLLCLIGIIIFLIFYKRKKDEDKKGDVIHGA